MDAEGRPFFQNANASKISSDGAFLSGIAHSLQAGEVVGIQYGEKKARFKVVWVIDAGSVRKTEAGVQLVDGQRSPWEDLTRNDGIVLPSGSNKRRFARYKVLFPIQIGLTDGRHTVLQTNAVDIGGRGCYVETLVPLSLGAKIDVTFWMDSEKIHTTGVVRTSDPGVGMGIEFTALDNLVQERLQAYLEKLNAGFVDHTAPNNMLE